MTESGIAEDKAKKSMIDAARLADELRAEQENAQMAERGRRVLDNQVKDMQTKLDEAEQLAVKGGKKVVSRLEMKIKDLEGQLDEEQRRLVDAQKSIPCFQNSVTCRPHKYLGEKTHLYSWNNLECQLSFTITEAWLSKTL